MITTPPPFPSVMRDAICNCVFVDVDVDVDGESVVRTLVEDGVNAWVLATSRVARNAKTFVELLIVGL